MKTDVTDLKQNATNAALSLQETQKNIKDQLESPLAIHYKGVTITPGGFLAAETVWRQHGLGCRHQHAVQLDSVRWRGAESLVGILRVGPPVAYFDAG